MGHNLDLTNIYGLPITTKCSICGEENETYFDDYDIDCGDPIEQVGDYTMLTLDVGACNKCNNEITKKYKIYFEVMEEE